MVRAMTANRKFRIVKSQSPTESYLATLVSIGTFALIVAFGALWLEFFRNIAALPSSLMFWHFHF
jgi:hypothetical protein